MDQSKPRIPLGNNSVLRGVGENFAFHSSPASFLAQRTPGGLAAGGSDSQKRDPIRAKILNRDVAIIMSYEHVGQVLNTGTSRVVTPTSSDDQISRNEGSSDFAAAASYNAFMREFFPPPNLLLNDGAQHENMRSVWQPIANKIAGGTDQIVEVVEEWLSDLSRDSLFDIYSEMKVLSWRIILKLFLGVHHSSRLFLEVVELQEMLLRGQFSLMPVSFRLGPFETRYKTGVTSRKKLQAKLRDQFNSAPSDWLPPDIWSSEHHQETVVNHVLMSTSSLAVKSFASLLTAFLLNLYLGHVGDEATHDWVSSSERERSKAVLYETMRLSPPIIGVMRRSSEDTVLKSTGLQSDVLIPKGWDVWPNFAAANRDQSVFGESADTFEPQRYCQQGLRSPPPPPLVFGSGPKKCLGENIVSNLCLLVGRTFSEKAVRLEGHIAANGVKAWLGWQKATSDEWARDMKQLPTQRPSNRIQVRLKSK